MMRLMGRVAIVTGGGSGIGSATANILCQHGATVVIADRDRIRAEAVVAAIRASEGAASSSPTNVTDAGQVNDLVDQTVATHGRLDILVNNAAIGPFKTVTDTTLAEWDELMDVNLKGVFLMSKHAIPYMRRQGGGTIINIASQLGLVGDSDHAAYCASKGGVVQLTRAMAVDHGRDQIRVNCICPGPTWTPLLENQFKYAPNPEQEQKRVESKLPLGRIARPEEIASVVLFLASDDSSYLTGSVVAADGGWTAQ